MYSLCYIGIWYKLNEIDVLGQYQIFDQGTADQDSTTGKHYCPGDNCFPDHI